MILRSAFLFCVLGIAASAFSATSPNYSESIRFPVEKYQLENGLTVLLHKASRAPLFSFHQWFKVGSVNENVGRTGLAHFFEHLMFKGTKNHKSGELFQLVQANGGYNNAFTSQDYTGYYEDMPSGQLELVMKLESDRMRNLLFDPKEIQSEREVVKEERRFRTEDNVMGALREAVMRTVFKVHPYRWVPIGSMEDLNAASIEDLKAFYNTYYAPNNAVIVIVGDFDVDKAKRWIKRYYGGIASVPVPPLDPPAEPPQTMQRTLNITKDTQTTTFSVAFKGAKAGDDDSYALDLIAGILGEGASSRLNKRLVYNQQIASQVYAGSESMKFPGIFQVVVAMRPGKNPDQALNGVYHELFQLQKTKVPDEELRKVKNQITKSYVDNLKTVAGKAQALANAEVLLGDYSTIFSDLDRYEAVTAEQIQKVAEQYFKPEGRSVVKIGPKLQAHASGVKQ